MEKGKPMPNGERSYLGGVFLRLFILAASVAVILTIGYYKYGWRPLGPRIHADQVGRSNPAFEIPAGEKEPDLSDVIKDAMQPDSGTPSTPSPPLQAGQAEVTPTPSPTPKPEDITKDDQKALKDLLKKEAK